MILFPAIDLYEGNAVRLKTGDFNKKTVYSHSPAEVARGFQRDGAKWLHIVDLMGAKTGEPSCTDVIARIIAETGLSVQTGGGIRTPETVELLIEAGVARIIIGTAAVTDKSFLCDCLRRFGNRIAVGADIRDGNIALKGWAVTSDIPVERFFDDMESLGVGTVICTDISKDGMLSGTNIGLYSHLEEKFDVNIIASGGVSSLEDIRTLSEMGLYGAILGKALYEGTLSLKKALQIAGGDANAY